jgi:NAD(P)H-quinone oxidoreductase subunit 5
VLAYASLTQVGIIVVEIGLGFYYLALVHMIGNACLRTMQLLRAPTLITDYQVIENAIGGRAARHSPTTKSKYALMLRVWLYRFGYERGFMDLILDQMLISPFRRLLEWSDRQESKWANFLNGPSDHNKDAK